MFDSSSFVRLHRSGSMPMTCSKYLTIHKCLTSFPTVQHATDL
jgi:hypothetical protein